MDFSLGPDNESLKDDFSRFAQRELNGDIQQRDKTGEFSPGAWKKCADMGVLGIPFPSEYGGSNLDIISTTAAMEGLGYGAEDRGLLFSINAQMWSIQMPILHFGTDEQKSRYLAGLIDGSIIGAHGMSEPSSGSDTFSMRTTAVKDGDHFILNGSKTWTTNGPVCDMLVVFANIDKPAGGFMGITAFLVDRETPGLTISKPIEKMGLTTSPMCNIYLDDVRVPASAVLGKGRQGVKIFNHSMEWERACILGVVVGAMEKQIENCLAYGNERVQFKRTISSNQAISHKIVEMKLRHETSRLMLYKVAWLKQQGMDATQAAALAKWHISEAAVKSGLDAIQIHGGMGYTVELGVERFLRDSIGARIYSGTNEIQKNIVAHTMGIK
jgi:alkylation response protein AidB-like acyl-CoA dehydrogenase